MQHFPTYTTKTQQVLQWMPRHWPNHLNKRFDRILCRFGGGLKHGSFCALIECAMWIYVLKPCFIFLKFRWRHEWNVRSSVPPTKLWITRPVTMGEQPLGKLLATPGKMCWISFEAIGHSSKNLGPSQKTLRPAWCPKLVTTLWTTDLNMGCGAIFERCQLSNIR